MNDAIQVAEQLGPPCLGDTKHPTDETLRSTARGISAIFLTLTLRHPLQSRKLQSKVTMLLSIGQLAKASGLTIRALHHYDAIRLLVPSQRSDAGYRMYSESDVTRLYRIQALQRLGLSLAEIGQALERDANTLEQIVVQQLAELDEQIARSTLLRSQLRAVHDRLQAEQGPSLDDWLSTLEMIATYDKHCSPEELNKLLTHRRDSFDDWRALIAEVREAMQRDMPAQSAAAQALARRWVRLVMARMGGDALLAKKMKALYYESAALQARTQADSGFDRAMMDFLMAATTAAHLGLWARHLTAEEIAKLNLSGAWAQQWNDVSSEARRAHAEAACEGDESGQSLARRWLSLISDFSGDNLAVARKVRRALHSDSDLQELWNVNSEVCALMERATESVK